MIKSYSYFNKPFVIFLFIIIAVFFAPNSAFATSAFITTWKTDNAGTSGSNQITIPTTGGGYSYDVDWGDSSTTIGATGNVTHTYISSGTYTVTITGTFPQIYFNNGGDKLKILAVTQWGTIVWRSMDNAFNGTSNLVISATDAPDLSSVTSMSYMFANSGISTGGNLNAWDVSHITDMFAVFYNATSFNQSLSSWVTTSVTSMGSTFNGASSFNQSINAWDVSNVTFMANMLQGSAYNQPLNLWDVSSVTNMYAMFSNNSAFNQALTSWDTSSVTDMSYMFYSATAFNQSINSWDVSHVTTLSNMFNGASSFNQTLNSWNVSSVTDFGAVFYNASAFNGAIGSWTINTSAPVTMNSMFSGASSFNQDISSWDVTRVTDMTALFKTATAFNQPLNAWSTKLSNVTDMNNMFYHMSFNQPLSSWDVSAVTNMSHMFDGDSAFNQDISSWDVSNVTNMNTMFYAASSFNQDISSWDVTNVTDMTDMFTSVTISTVNYDALLAGWSLETLHSGVTFGAGSSEYCSSNTQRSSIISTYSWTINDGGPSCTFAPTLTSPASSHTYLNSSSLSVSFVLPVLLLSNSLTLTFIPSIGSTIVINLTDAAPVSTNTFTLPLTGGISSVTEVVSTTANSIPVGTYTVVLSYQDSYGNPAATATATNVVIAAPTTTTTTGSTTILIPSTPTKLVTPTIISNPSPNVKIQYQFFRNMKLGMTGGDIKELQKFLNNHNALIASEGAGSPGNETTIFGPKTKLALMKYQKANNIFPASGLFGPLTTKFVNSLLLTSK